MLSCLFLATFLPSAGKALTSWFSCVLCFLLFLSLSHMVFRLIVSIPDLCLTLYLCLFYLGSYQPFVCQFLYGIIRGFYISFLETNGYVGYEVMVLKWLF